MESKLIVNESIKNKRELQYRGKGDEGPLGNRAISSDHHEDGENNYIDGQPYQKELPYPVHQSKAPAHETCRKRRRRKKIAETNDQRGQKIKSYRPSQPLTRLND
jgi:hypothetical protein